MNEKPSSEHHDNELRETETPERERPDEGRMPGVDSETAVRGHLGDAGSGDSEDGAPETVRPDFGYVTAGTTESHPVHPKDLTKNPQADQASRRVEHQNTMHTDFWSSAPRPIPGTDEDSRDIRADFSLWLRNQHVGDGKASETLASIVGEEDDEARFDEPALPTEVEDVYEDRGEIGQGGMGTVRQVFDRRLRREAALKILKEEMGSKHREVRRFVEEAQITGQLDHPNIVPIHDLGRDAQGSHYFTMKLVQGNDLETAIEDLGPKRLDPDTLADNLQIFIKVCEAVSFAHSRGVIHRDLKPSNIMVGEYGQVYVMDWGIARLLHLGGPANDTDTSSVKQVVTVSRSENMDIDSPGTIVGTPRYMAPEQVQGQHDRTDHRADIFALGGTLYHMLTGHAPYIEQNYFALLVKVQNCDIARPSQMRGYERVPLELERIAFKAMAADPDDRYQSVVELQKDLERFLRGIWHLPTETFAAGEAIIREGDDGNCAYIIRRGRCRVIKHIGGEIAELRRMGPGDVFGETAIFSAGRRSATVEALEEVEVTVVTSDILTQGLGLNSWMGDFVKALANRFREADERLAGISDPQNGGDD